MPETIICNKTKLSHRLLIATPTLGRVRYEWAAARYGQIIPINWQVSELAVGCNSDSQLFPTAAPVGFLVHDAYNLVVEHALKHNFEWVLCIEDDTIPPPDLFIRMRAYMDKGDIPVVSGLYYTKGFPSEPLLFRGRGNGAFFGWKLGERVWVDGVPMGCLLIHMSLLKYMYDNSPEYTLSNGHKLRKVFDTPRERWIDPATGFWNAQVGTQDLYWCDRVIKENVLEKTGWKKIAKKKWPFLVDTTIFCKHIDLNSGVQYPL